MNKYDIVYFLKNGIDSAELKYSLRSVAKNFPHNRLWFAGGQPKDLIPDARLAIRQNAKTKWENVRNMLRKICSNDDITESFWLFNDDFFIMKPWQSDEPLYHDSLEHHIQHIEHRHDDKKSEYTINLRQCKDMLEAAGYGTLNYAIHCPMLIDRKKMLETLDVFPDCPMFRSLYGNMHAIGGTEHYDCKVAGFDRIIEDEWISTTDTSFRLGRIGRYIRKSFPDPCAYERQ